MYSHKGKKTLFALGAWWLWLRLVGRRAHTQFGLGWMVGWLVGWSTARSSMNMGVGASFPTLRVRPRLRHDEAKKRAKKPTEFHALLLVVSCQANVVVVSRRGYTSTCSLIARALCSSSFHLGAHFSLLPVSCLSVLFVLCCVGCCARNNE